MDTIEPVRLTKTRAAALTERIRDAVGETWRLLTDAHDGRAWLALDYPTWEAYILAEFGISSSSASRGLDQGTVILALEAAAGATLPPGTISQRAAAGLKHDLPAVVERVKTATRGKQSRARQKAAESIVGASPQVSGPRARALDSQLSLFDLAQPIPHRPPANTVEAERARTLARQLNTWAARLDNNTAPTRQVVSRLKGQKPA